MGGLILIVPFLAGFAFGFWRARRRGGKLADALQWGFGHAVAGFALGALASFLLGMFGVGT